MKYLVLLYFIIFSIFQVEYTNIYQNDYKWAVKFLKKHKREIVRKSMQYSTDKEIMVSTIFPEIIRYSIFKDYFETKGLELIYIDHGKKYADFSIGYLQMKPSFYEKIEEFVQGDDSLKINFNHIIKYSGKSEKQIRKERLVRLKSFDWQLEYLNCFYIITEMLHDTIWINKTDKIKFFATAYNHGFYKEKGEIEKWIDIAAFPYGIESKAKQYVYSDISRYFYENSYREVFK